MGPVQLIEAINSQIDALGSNDLVIGLCSTSPAGGKAMNYFSFPRVHSEGFVYIHVVLRDTATALKIVDDNRFSHAVYFIDIENKNPEFSAPDIINRIGRENCHPIEPNSLTVDALVMHIFKAGYHLKVLVAGSGLLARSLCSRLQTSHADYWWTAKKGRSGTSRMGALFPDRQANDKMRGSFDIIINCIPISDVIDFNAWVKPDCRFIEASGVSLPELVSLNCTKLRLDVSAEQLAFVANRRHLIKHGPAFGHGEFSGYRVCSGGYIGDAGDVVVDNFQNPSFVIGIADGVGGFSKRHAVPFDVFLSQTGK